MRCTVCGFIEDKVIDSRESADGKAIRRRRECLKCGKRFTTYEYIEEPSLMVIKKDGRRQPFDRQKVLSGIIKACEKRPISMDKMEQMLIDIEREIQKCPEREISTTKVGEFVIKKLKEVDDVAYVRFASVYRQFKDVEQFMVELKAMLKKEKFVSKKKK